MSTLPQKRLQACKDAYGDSYKFLVQRMTAEIKKDFAMGPLRARAGHETVDAIMKESQEANPIKVSCQKKCTFCCYQKIPLTESEADLIEAYLNEKEIILPSDAGQRLSRQRRAIAEDRWDGLRHGDKRCVFLGDDDLCQIYPVRPMTCRVHLVVTPKDNCNTRFGVQPVGMVQVPSVDLALTAFTLADGLEKLEETISHKFDGQIDEAEEK